jgi:hypothetical protein
VTYQGWSSTCGEPPAFFRQAAGLLGSAIKQAPQATIIGASRIRRRSHHPV